MSVADDIRRNLDRILETAGRASARAGRGAEAVSIVAVSKKQPIDRILAYCGICSDRNLPVIFGENYVQEFRRRRESLSGNPHVSHLIGPLQTNKAGEAVELFDVIESVHSVKVAREINRRAGLIGKRQRIMLQVNISNDPAKSGFSGEEALEFACGGLLEPGNLEFCGLMTITLNYEIPEEARPDFIALRNLRDKIKSLSGRGNLLLSMGMSADFGIAIEEGADLVRIGTALFGQRQA